MQGANKYAIFAADFETTFHKQFTETDILLENKQSLTLETSIDFSPNKSSQVFLVGLQSLATKEYMLSYEDLTIFFYNIVQLTTKEFKQKALVYFHNLAYDGDYILKWLLNHGYKQTVKTNEYGKEVIGYKEFCLLRSNGKFFSLTFKWKGLKIKFLDSLKIFPSTLEKLGEIIGYKKLKETVDYKQFKLNKQHNYPKEWLIYLKRDVEILTNILINFFKHEPLKLNCQTIGSIAYQNIKNIIEDKFNWFTIKDYFYYEHYFHGGLCFPSFNAWAKWIKGDIKMIDACSMYPSQMIKYLPTGQPLNKRPINNYTTFYEIKIIQAKIKNKYASFACIWKPFKMDPISHKKYILLDNNETSYQYLQIVKKATYYVIKEELEMWEQLYNIKYKIIKQTYFKLDNYLKNTILRMFVDKQVAPKNSVQRTLAKLKLNNLYGKTGQKPIRSQDYFNTKESLDLTKWNIEGEKNTIYDAYNISRKLELSDQARPILLASYITCLSRVTLLKRIKYIIDNGGTFLYCDTDSITYINHKNIQFNDIGNELGKWEYENIDGANLFCALAPKHYRICNNETILKTACAGVKKAEMLKVKNEDYNYDLGTNKLYNINRTNLKEDINGKTIWQSPFNFKKWSRIKENPIYEK